jgi:hypothetical protein
MLRDESCQGSFFMSRNFQAVSECFFQIQYYIVGFISPLALAVYHRNHILYFIKYCWVPGQEKYVSQYFATHEYYLERILILMLREVSCQGSFFMSRNFQAVSECFFQIQYYIVGFISPLALAVYHRNHILYFIKYCWVPGQEKYVSQYFATHEYYLKCRVVLYRQNKKGITVQGCNLFN